MLLLLFFGNRSKKQECVIMTKPLSAQLADLSVNAKKAEDAGMM